MFDLNPKDSGKFKWAEGKGERGCRVSRVEHNMCTGSGVAWGSEWEGAGKREELEQAGWLEKNRAEGDVRPAQQDV